MRAEAVELKLIQEPQEQAVAALRLVIADRYRASLYCTVKDLLGYADTNRQTHGDMIDALEASTKRKLIVMPRGTFKSSIAVVGYSIWLLMSNPNLRILIDSEKYENSKNFIREIKRKLEEPKMIALFGEFASEDNWSEGSITIKQRTKIFKESSITASGVEAGKTGQHYDIIIHDDLNSPENSENHDQRVKVINHYRMNTSILEPEGTMVLIGTRYATADCVGWVLENEVKQL